MDVLLAHVVEVAENICLPLHATKSKGSEGVVPSPFHPVWKVPSCLQWNVIPKMQLLEDHVIPWIRRFGLGAGLMGEQGAESIHAHLNRLESTYTAASPTEWSGYTIHP